MVWKPVDFGFVPKKNQFLANKPLTFAINVFCNYTRDFCYIYIGFSIFLENQFNISFLIQTKNTVSSMFSYSYVLVTSILFFFCTQCSFQDSDQDFFYWYPFKDMFWNSSWNISLSFNLFLFWEINFTIIIICFDIVLITEKLFKTYFTLFIRR